MPAGGGGGGPTTFILVQSFLNSATNVNLSVNLSSTVSTIKNAMYAAEGVSPAVMDLYFASTIMANANTLSSYGVSNLSYIRSHNRIARLGSKEAKQNAKLALAELDRAASGKRSTLDITQLPNPYNGNVANPDENANTGGLVVGRPWV